MSARGGEPPLLPAWLARSLPGLALAALGAVHWMDMLEPAAPRRGWQAVGIAVLVGAGLLLAGRLRPRAGRWAAAAAVAAAGAGLALLAAGVADELLRPDGWGTLAAGVGRGLEALPGARVPFRGADEWTRTVLAAGGTLLAPLAAGLALWPRAGGRLGFRRTALALLVVLSVVPIVALAEPGGELRGAALLLLVVAFERLERQRRRDAPAALAVALAVALVALLAGPALDRPGPWWDYEAFALSTASARTTAFSWDHRYGALDWPRDGRELLRVRARRAAYWKAENLDVFDGAAWRRSFTSNAPDPQVPSRTADLQGARKWRQRIGVSVRNLRSREVLTAGTPLDVQLRPNGSLASVPGVRVTSGRPLRRGDVYSADVYVPEPSGEQLRAAGTDYERWLAEYLAVSVRLPGTPARGARVGFAAFDRPSTAGFTTIAAPGEAVPGEGLLERSGLGRSLALARRLRSQSRTPYGYVRRVEAYLRQPAFSYSERPPRAAGSLEGFLFDARSGFCQQYSGAMALLLRMGGVPARVSAGFTAGALDRGSGEYVVRDYDAHSWVEAWFPGYGWVTFDPTPSAAPPRSRTGEASLGATPLVGGDRPESGRAVPGRAGGAPAVAGEEGGGAGRLAAVGAAVLALAGLAVALTRRGRRRGVAAPAPLRELERALRRAGRDPEAATTLQALEARFAPTPAAAAYVRALRTQRYGGPSGGGPTPAQRRGLRAELGRGRGLAGRLRAWWAVPPRLQSGA